VRPSSRASTATALPCTNSGELGRNRGPRLFQRRKETDDARIYARRRLLGRAPSRDETSGDGAGAAATRSETRFISLTTGRGRGDDTPLLVWLVQRLTRVGFKCIGVAMAQNGGIKIDIILCISRPPFVVSRRRGWRISLAAFLWRGSGKSRALLVPEEGRSGRGGW